LEASISGRSAAVGCWGVAVEGKTFAGRQLPDKKAREKPTNKNNFSFI
jgi:hypothetical protein